MCERNTISLSLCFVRPYVQTRVKYFESYEQCYLILHGILNDHCLVASNPAFNSEDPGFKYRPGGGLSRLRFSVAFLSLPRQMPG
jgi:hypothetical protein